jgi:hypothetical protein
MISAEVKLNTLLGLIEFILILLDVEKIKVVVKPCHMLALITNFVPCLLKLEHVQCGF